MTNEPVALDGADIAWAFPSVEPGAKPLGGRILVQLRRTKKKTTAGGIILVEETKEAEKWNNMVAKVVEVGPLAFKNRDTMQSWPVFYSVKKKISNSKRSAAPLLPQRVDLPVHCRPVRDQGVHLRLEQERRTERDWRRRRGRRRSSRSSRG